MVTIDRRLSIGRLFAHFAADRPHDIALVDSKTEETVTWGDLDLWTNRLAREYERKGVAQDDVVVIALPNSARFVLAAVAAWKLGATVLPLSTRLTVPERARILDLAEAALVVEVEGTVHAEDQRVASLSGDLRALDRSSEPLPDRVPTYWKALTSGGSTGLPKLIFSHDDPHYDPTTAPVPYMHADGVHLVCGPMYHNAAFIYAARGLFCGNRLVIMDRFDSGSALDLIEQHRVTWLQLVPTMMNRLHRLPTERRTSADLSSVRTLLHVGGPCPPALKSAFIDWLGPDRVTEVYAGTENQGITLVTGPEWLKHPGSVGRAIRGSRFRVLDGTGADLPPGEVGEVFLMPAGGQGSTYHYVGAEPRSRDGWESLGDLGYTDDEGYLYLVDRSTDCIVTGGANVYPAEVEAALEALPGVRAAAVIGLPDDDLGQRVVAVVEPEPDAELTADGLHRSLSDSLAAAKRPRAYEMVTGPLRDEAGKVRRSALRQQRLPGGSHEGQLVIPSVLRWRGLRSGNSGVDRLLRVLDVDEIGPDLFAATSLPRPSSRIFGGQVLAQSVVAAARTLDRPEPVLHSLHGYFVRMGAPEELTRLSVTRLRDGRSFDLRQVNAWQNDELIATVTASFQLPEAGGLVHQTAAPTPPPPDDLEPRYPFAAEDGDPSSAPIEMRDASDTDPEAPVDVWLRVRGALPDDLLLHQALIIYMSDFSIVRAAFRRHGVDPRQTRAASLDHAIWLHRPARADRWLHYHTECPIAEASRAWGSGAMYADGRLVASIGQEMVVRPRARASAPGTAPPPSAQHHPAPTAAPAPSERTSHA